METKTYVYDGIGVVDAIIYDKETVEHTRFNRSLIEEIYANSTGFNKNIILVTNVDTFNKKTIKNVIKSFVTEVKTEDVLVIALAGTLHLTESTGTIYTAAAVLQSEKDALRDNNFYQINWNNCMSKNYENGNYFILNNKAGKNYMSNYTGENKPINRYYNTES